MSDRYNLLFKILGLIASGLTIYLFYRRIKQDESNESDKMEKVREAKKAKNDSNETKATEL